MVASTPLFGFKGCRRSPGTPFLPYEPGILVRVHIFRIGNLYGGI